MSTKHLAKIIADTISPSGHRITTAHGDFRETAYERVDQ